VGVEPTMADLQSAALATWLRSHHAIAFQGFNGPATAGQGRSAFVQIENVTVGSISELQDRETLPITTPKSSNKLPYELNSRCNP